MEISIEISAIRFRPFLIRLLAQKSQKPRVIAGAAELYRVQFGDPEKIQKFVVSLNAGIVAHRRHHTADIAGDSGSTEVFQHGYPLVAFLHIEIAQIFVANNRVTDARISQMVGAQADPFGGEFRINAQKRKEVCGEGRNASGGFGAHDAVRRDLNHADV